MEFIRDSCGVMHNIQYRRQVICTLCLSLFCLIFSSFVFIPARWIQVLRQLIKSQPSCLISQIALQHYRMISHISSTWAFSQILSWEIAHTFVSPSEPWFLLLFILIRRETVSSSGPAIVGSYFFTGAVMIHRKSTQLVERYRFMGYSCYYFLIVF